MGIGIIYPGISVLWVYASENHNVNSDVYARGDGERVANGEDT